MCLGAFGFFRTPPSTEDPVSTPFRAHWPQFLGPVTSQRGVGFLFPRFKAKQDYSPGASELAMQNRICKYTSALTLGRALATTVRRAWALSVLANGGRSLPHTGHFL